MDDRMQAKRENWGPLAVRYWLRPITDRKSHGSCRTGIMENSQTPQRCRLWPVPLPFDVDPAIAGSSRRDSSRGLLVKEAGPLSP